MNIFSNSILKSIAIGFFAALLNTAFLRMAVIFEIQVESGGLLKLLLFHFVSGNFQTFILKSTTCTLGFHLITGILLSLFYRYLFLPIPKLQTWLKGLSFGSFIWLINGLFVLPELQQGLFGHLTLSSFGIVWFLKANLLFGYLVAVGHKYLFNNPLGTINKDQRVSNQLIN